MRKVNGHWYIRYQLDGVEYSAPTGLEATERNRKKALQKEAEHRQFVLDGKASHLRLKARPFNDAAREFLQWAETEYPKVASYRRIRSSFSFLIEHFGKTSVASLTAGHLEHFKTVRRGMGIKEISIRHDLHALSRFFHFACKHNWARKNIVSEVRIPSDAEAVRINPLSIEQEALYFKTCLALNTAAKQASQTKNRTQERSYADLYDFGRLMIQHGCRPEEFLELRKASVDPINRWLFIESGKTAGARRRLKLTAESQAVLQRRLQTPGPYVFPSPWDPQKPRTTFQRVHDAVLAECGLSFVLYDLRHTFATRAAAEGVPIPVLAAMLGHSPKNLRSVAHYVHVSADHIDAETDRLERNREAEKIRQKRASEKRILSTVARMEQKL